MKKYRPPKKLFKYEKITPRTLCNLRSHVVFFGSPLKLNDPFDCALTPRILPPREDRLEEVREHFLGAGMDSTAIQEAKEMSVEELRDHLMSITGDSLNGLVEDFSRKHGVTCFSETNDNLLMWSHYANGGSGMCLEFGPASGLFEKMFRVEYSRKIPGVDPVAVMLREYGADMARELFVTKSMEWVYEREWRAFHSECNREFPFNPKGLRNIFLGPRIEERSASVITNFVKARYPWARVWLGRKSRVEFKLVFGSFGPS